MYYGLRYAARVLGTPVPEAVLSRMQRAGPRGPMRWWMDALFMRALVPYHASCADRYSSAARWLLYVRSHYLRMPLHLLLPHLLRKAWIRRTQA